MRAQVPVQPIERLRAAEAPPETGAAAEVGETPHEPQRATMSFGRLMIGVPVSARRSPSSQTRSASAIAAFVRLRRTSLQ